MSSSTSASSRVKAVAVGAVLLTLAGTGGAFAAGQIGSKQIADDSIRSVDLQDGSAVAYGDLRPALQDQLDAAANAAPTTVTFGTENGDSEVANQRTIVLKAAPGDATSVEAENTGLTVSAGDIISFDVTMQGAATCAAGSPRVYVKVADQVSNSYDPDNSTHGCPGDNAPNSDEDGRINFVVPDSGSLDSLYFVHDNGSGGTVYVENLLVNGQEVLFN